jgi:hypothetical protein
MLLEIHAYGVRMSGIVVLWDGLQLLPVLPFLILELKKKIQTERRPSQRTKTIYVYIYFGGRERVGLRIELW